VGFVNSYPSAVFFTPAEFSPFRGIGGVVVFTAVVLDELEELDGGLVTTLFGSSASTVSFEPFAVA
jgi:hypothetical protein